MRPAPQRSAHIAQREFVGRVAGLLDVGELWLGWQVGRGWGGQAGVGDAAKRGHRCSAGRQEAEGRPRTLDKPVAVDSTRCSMSALQVTGCAAAQPGRGWHASADAGTAWLASASKWAWHHRVRADGFSSTRAACMTAGPAPSCPPASILVVPRRRCNTARARSRCPLYTGKALLAMSPCFPRRTKGDNRAGTPQQASRYLTAQSASWGILPMQGGVRAGGVGATGSSTAGQWRLHRRCHHVADCPGRLPGRLSQRGTLVTGSCGSLLSIGHTSPPPTNQAAAGRPAAG